MPTRIEILSVPVRDPEAAKVFYRDVLGFTVVRDDPMGPDRRWITLAPPGGAPSITLVTWFPQMRPGGVTGLVLGSDDVDADVEELRRRGLEVGELQDAPWGRFATFDDPDGNGWVLQQTVPDA